MAGWTKASIWLILLSCWLAAACTRPASISPAGVTPLAIQLTISPTGEGISEGTIAPPNQPATAIPDTDQQTDGQTSVQAETQTAETDSAQAPTEVQPQVDTGAGAPVEQPVVLLPLDGAINSPQAEISGMDWYGERLVLLPQYPGRFAEGGNGSLFVLDKSEILAFLAGESAGPLQPRRLPIVTQGIEDQIPGFEGFEAIAFNEDRVYLTIEARPGEMLGYLVSGFVGGDLEWLSLDSSSLVPIQPQTNIPNLSDESLTIFGSRLVTVYEANGALVNPQPVAHLFTATPQLQDQLSFPNIEYRLTDATSVDDFGRFWEINTFFTGDSSLLALSDPLIQQYGEGATHSQSIAVERLVEFQFSEQGIVLSETPPIQLELSGHDETRNWEAIARLDESGFLLATDKFPQTLFAFVALPP